MSHPKSTDHWYYIPWQIIFSPGIAWCSVRAKVVLALNYIRNCMVSHIYVYGVGQLANTLLILNSLVADKRPV